MTSVPSATAAPNPYARAQFRLSASHFSQLPNDSIPEAAFVGRSNAGKSSAINAICEQRSLARVSKTPGRTQLINLFDIENARLVDLPGYGFAQVPIKVRDAWGALVGGYVQKRESLSGLIVVMDIRHPLTDLDVQMLEWCRSRGVATHVLLTKADKLRFGAAKSTLLAVQKALAEFDSAMTAQIFSAPARTGLEEVRAQLSRWLFPSGIETASA